MLRNIFNVIADVVHVACRAEHHDASLFVLDYDVDQPVTDVLSPTQVRALLASGSIETKTGRLFDLQICCRLLALASALKLIFNVLPFVE